MSCRIRFILASALLSAITTAHLSAFPDMRNYPHQHVTINGIPTACSLPSDNFRLLKCSYQGFRGYHGECPITGYYIEIQDGEYGPVCEIFKDGQMESSVLCEENKVQGVTAYKFYFMGGKTEGRLNVAAFSDTDREATWQSLHG